jgi:hypothetical protein
MSVGWASVCCAGGCGSIPGRTNTQGLKITEEKVLPLQSHLQTVRLSSGSDDHLKMAVPSLHTSLTNIGGTQKNHWGRKETLAVTRFLSVKCFTLLRELLEQTQNKICWNQINKKEQLLFSQQTVARSWKSAPCTHCTRTNTQGLKITEEEKVLPLCNHICKRLDFRVARMTT